MEFLVLPDTADAATLGTEYAARASSTVLRHASGRPWIVGRWNDSDIVVATAGTNRIALFGYSRATLDDVCRWAERSTAPADLDGFTRSVPGAFHLIASINGRVRAQGTLSTTHQVFYATTRAGTIAADRPSALAALIDAGVADELLAVRLLAPWPPWPLTERGMWTGVWAVPTGQYLDLDRTGRGRAVRWWEPPAPDVPLAAAAERIRAATLDAVAARVRPGRPISADLSGGLDSTSLCFLAADQTSRLTMTSWRSGTATDDDQAFADLAAGRVPDAEHVALPLADSPSWFTGVSEPDDDVEAPLAWIRTRARLGYQASVVAGRGSTAHLTGHGGDELFLATGQLLHALVRSRPTRTWPHIRMFRALNRWRPAETLRALADRRTFGRWLTDSADQITDPPSAFARRPDFGWWIGYTMPSWATPDAVDAARAVLLESGAAEPAPLAPTRAQHAVIADARLCGDSIRRVDRITRRNGVSWQAPYLDDQVVDAALSVRFADVVGLDRYKPALTRAMDGIVPADILGRTNKSEYSAEGYVGLRRNRSELVDLCDDLRLARLGLVDADAFRAALTGTHSTSLTMFPIVSTLACESWLRSLSAVEPAGTVSKGSR